MIVSPPTGALIARKINKITRHFVEAGAFTDKTAINPAELGFRKGFIFNRLVRNGVLVEGSQQRYFLNRENLVIYQGNKRRKIVIAILFIFFLIVITSLLTR